MGSRLGFALSFVLVSIVACAAQESGYRIVRAPHSFARLEERLRAAIEARGMVIVTRASASDGARGRGVTIPGDAVYGVFRNDYAVRMLAANVDAGIDAPVRLHLVEEADGTASIRYVTPGALFGRYDGEAIRALGRDLDPVISAIVADAVAP